MFWYYKIYNVINPKRKGVRMVESLETVVVILASLVTILANGDKAILNAKAGWKWIREKFFHKNEESDE